MNPLLRSIPAALIAAFVPFLTLAADRCAAQEVRVDDALAPLCEKHGVPALGAAVLVDGELAAIGVAGVRKVGDDAAVTVDDLWHLGSCTKAMTATLLARRVEAGELTFATTVADALPDLRDGMHASARAITVSQLLRHRAGLPNIPPQPLWMELFRYDGTDREARVEVAKEMLGVEVEAEPGARYLYSNAGYMIAGAIAERLGDDDWQALMRAQLFAPLHMTGVGFGMPGREGEVAQPWGHVKVGERQVPRFGDNPSPLGPAGTVHATLRDWAKFARLHLGVAPKKDEQPLLRDATLRVLHTPEAGEDYALGWSVARRGWAPGPILTHAGSNTMWYCVAWLAPEIDFAVLVTCNSGDGAAACDAVAGAMIRKFCP